MKTLEFKTSKGEFILEEASDKNLGRVLVKHMTEEQFAEVVDSDDDYGVTMYQNYATTSMAYFDEQITAKESFESLVKSLGYYLFDNPKPIGIMAMTNKGIFDTAKEEFDLAESKTFYKPILLKKI